MGGSHLGDVLCTSTLPRLLHCRAGIEVWVSDDGAARDVFANNPYVRGLTADAGIALTPRACGIGHVIQRLAQSFELPIESPPRPELYLTEAERDWARRERARWPADKRVCVVSPSAISTREQMERVDWAAVGATLSRRYTVVQPTVGEPPMPSALICPGIDRRRYMALIGVADLFVGGSSGGMHVAAALRVPALAVIWRSLEAEARFPVAIPWSDASFLYPMHAHISCEDLLPGSFDEGLLLRRIMEAEARGRLSDADLMRDGALGCRGFAPRPPARIQRVNNRRFVRVRGSYGACVGVP